MATYTALSRALVNASRRSRSLRDLEKLVAIPAPHMASCLGNLVIVNFLRESRDRDYNV